MDKWLAVKVVKLFQIMMQKLIKKNQPYDEKTVSSYEIAFPQLMVRDALEGKNKDI